MKHLKWLGFGLGLLGIAVLISGGIVGVIALCVFAIKTWGVGAAWSIGIAAVLLACYGLGRAMDV